jgi:protein SCO1
MKPHAVMAGVLLSAAWSAAGAAIAPPPHEAIGFDQNLGASIPVSARFIDERGRRDTLANFIDGEPAVLLMGYNHCPNLCSTVRSSLTHALRSTHLAPGSDYHVLSVSIDDGESLAMPAAAVASPDVPPSALQYTDSQRGWHFLRSDRKAIDALAASVGFHYRYDANSGQYAHPAGIVILTPQGSVSHYFFGVDFPPQELEDSLAAARRDRIGSPVRALLLRCFHYDPAIGAYSATVELVVRLVAAASCAGLLVLWLGLRRSVARPRAQGDCK